MWFYQIISSRFFYYTFRETKRKRIKMCNDVLSTQLYFPSLTYFIHTHFSSQLTSEIRLHKDLQLFFSRYKTYITSFVLQTSKATWLIWETLRMEDDSRLYIFRLFLRIPRIISLNTRTIVFQSHYTMNQNGTCKSCVNEFIDILVW